LLCFEQNKTSESKKQSNLNKQNEKGNKTKQNKTKQIEQFIVISASDPRQPPPGHKILMAGQPEAKSDGLKPLRGESAEASSSANETRRAAVHSHTLSGDTGVLSKARGDHLKDPGVFLRDPGVLSKDPGVLLKDPGIL